MLDKLVVMARRQDASDLHLEPGLAPAIRVRGRLKSIGEPVSGKALLAAAREVIPADLWDGFLARRSFDASRVIANVPCRINVLQSARGVGLAIRLLAIATPTLAELNLHPDLAELARRRHGLVVVSGATGSGKSSTLAALVQTINVERPAHIITIEQPIEYHLKPARAFIRQREVGRDTPSFEQALVDALREDPDVIVVGEMRHRETMQLTLDAAETGHLVLATMHASTPAEALQRVVSAFAPESQAGVRAQLADSLVAVVCQSLEHRADCPIRVPECEILASSSAVRANIREGQFFKLTSAMEIGAADGSFTRQRYRAWLDTRGRFHVPELRATDAPAVAALGPEVTLPSLASVAAGRRPVEAVEGAAPSPRARPAAVATRAADALTTPQPEPVIVIEDEDADIDDLIAALQRR